MDVDTTVTPSMVEEGENASVCVTILPPATLEREVSILITTAALSKYLVTSDGKWDLICSRMCVDSAESKS